MARKQSYGIPEKIKGPSQTGSLSSKPSERLVFGDQWILQNQKVWGTFRITIPSGWIISVEYWYTWSTNIRSRGWARLGIQGPDMKRKLKADPLTPTRAERISQCLDSSITIQISKIWPPVGSCMAAQCLSQWNHRSKVQRLEKRGTSGKEEAKKVQRSMNIKKKY